MRFPIGATGSLEEYLRYWYLARTFGQRIADPAGDWWHEGVDLNLKTGGNTDLGEPVYAIADGRVVYYHRYTHAYTPNTYGKHLIMEFIAPDGNKYWAHYAHLQDQDFLNAAIPVTKGQKLGLVGTSGTTLAHLHFSIFKKDPVGNIDRWARSLADVNEWWVDPIELITRWMTPATGDCVITDNTVIPQIGNKTVGQIRSELAGYESKIAQIRTIVQQ